MIHKHLVLEKNSFPAHLGASQVSIHSPRLPVSPSPNPQGRWGGNLCTVLLGLFFWAAIESAYLGSAIAQTLPVDVNRWLEIIRIRKEVIYQDRQQKQRQAKMGDRLQEQGEGVITGNRSSTVLKIDTNIGNVNVTENTTLRVKELRITPNQGRVTLLEVTRGLARIRIRSFNNPESTLEIHTPAGIAGVRGTEFGVGVDPTGKTNIATSEGTVEATAQGETVEVESGFGSIIIPGEPPTSPQLLTNDVSLRGLRLFRTSLGTLEVKGRVDPFNLVWLNDQQVIVDRDGKFRTIIPVPTSFRLKIKVQSPLGREANYPLLVR